MKTPSIILTLLLLEACYYNIMGHRIMSIERVKIMDAGEIYGYYKFSSLDSLLLMETIRKPDLVFYAMEHCRQDFWPVGIRTLESRLAHRDIIYRYKVYRFANFGSRMILFIPPEKNKHMPEPYRPTKPFYMVINIRATSSG